MRYVLLLAPFFLFAAENLVISTSDDESVTGTLPYWILNSVAGDSIVCDPSIAGMTITLGKSLPAVTANLTISGGAGAAVTIDGVSLYQGFSFASGTTAILTNFNVNNCVSAGGAGANGSVGGGGGAGGGGALYVHNGVIMTASAISFTNNEAIGGTGGNGSGTLGGGGGGGGFGGGAGGANGGGGGGGNSNGGAGGGSTAGSTGIFFGGGGGGTVGTSGGGANNKGGTTPSNTYSGGTSSGSNGGGGGAGAGGDGTDSTTSAGTAGGIGLGSDTFFGGGGGGAGGSNGDAGAGFGSGGGGGTTNGTGGAGGAYGGGGGGGVGNDGGKGGFGAGGGGSNTGSGGGTIFGGGSGGSQSGAGGGGGAGMGGAIFIDKGATLTLSDTLSFTTNAAIGGSSGGGGATAGGSYGPDIFMQSGSNLIFNLSGALTIGTVIASDQNIGGGSGGGLNLQGTGTLTLTADNTFTGSTTISSGTLSISQSGALGSSTQLIMNAGTLFFTNPMTISNTTTLTGAANLDLNNQLISFTGNIGGSGSLTVVGTSGVLTMSGTNSYSGGTTLGDTVTLIGNANTPTLQGDFTLGSGTTLRFLQTQNGTYSGDLSGAGTVEVKGNSKLIVTGTSSDFTGTFHLFDGVNGQIDGSLGDTSTVQVDLRSILSGSGSVGNILNAGTISPGDGSSIGELNGKNVTFSPGSKLKITLNAGRQSDRLAIEQVANLQGHVTFDPRNGFYGFGSAYLFLTSATRLGTEFTSFSVNKTFNPTISGEIHYRLGNAIFLLEVLEPFFGFPFSNTNTKNVGNNIDALNVAGELTPELKLLIQSLATASFPYINQVLDQLHPATYSAFEEIQSEVGDQILNLLHRKPYLPCGCKHEDRVWATPFGTWQDVGNKGEEIGFEAKTRGITFGYDRSLGEYWVVGGAACYAHSQLTLNSGRGVGDVDRFLGGVYSDFMVKDFYMGLSAYTGWDYESLARNISFPHTSFVARGKPDAVEMGAQIATAYLFGVPACLFYPYANFDFFYANTQGFSEDNADAVNLTVQERSIMTLRAESGVALTIQDANFTDTICISPTFSLGWSMESPLSRPPFVANFQDEPITYQALGWDHSWQLFTFDFVLKISLWDFDITGEYYGELSPEGKHEFFGQRCNIGFSYSW